MYMVILYFWFVLDSIKCFSRCRGYQSIFLSICCVYTKYIYVPLVMSNYLRRIVLLDLLWCLVYYMLSKTRRNSINRSLHRVIAYTMVSVILRSIYFDAWCITCCWGIINSAMFAGGVRFHTTTVVFLNTVVVMRPFFALRQKSLFIAGRTSMRRVPKIKNSNIFLYQGCLYDSTS